MRLNYVPGRWLRMAILAGGVLAASTGTIFSQSTVATGSISGILTDPNGVPAGDVNVVIKGVSAGPQIAVTTTTGGIYSSGPILPGDYTVHVEVKGFASIDFPVHVIVGNTSSSNIRLQQNGAKVTRKNRAGRLNAAQPTVQGVITSQQLDDLPLNGRNFLDLAQLEPGVQILDAASLDPTKSGLFAVSIAGQSGRITRTLLDGIDITDERVGSVTQNVSPSSIREFQVAQSSLDLSSAMTSSGTVNAITRAGTNSYHGGGFYGFRDQDLGFAAFPGGQSPYFQRNQFGGNLGGAIIQDKLFFFVSAERTKQGSRSAAALDYPFNGLRSSYNTPFRDNTLLARFDWVGEHMRAFYRASYDEDSDIGPGNNFSPYLTHDITPAQVVGVDFNQGSLAHSIRASYSRYSNHLGLPNEGGFLNPDPSLNIQNTGLNIGPNPFAPQATIQSNKQIRYDGSKIRGSHIFRFGATFNRIDTGGYAAMGSLGATVTGSAALANEQAILGNPNAYGPALIPGDPAGALDNPLNYPVASILISNGQGFFSKKSAFGFPHGGLTDNRIDLYGGDAWKIRPNFTLTYGLHYTRDGGLTNSDLAGIPQLNGFGATLGNNVRQPNLNFAPQLGLIWAPLRSDRTVLRAGAGLYYDSGQFGNALVDRALRLQQGQYFAQQSLCGPGEYSALLPNGTAVTSSDGLNIGSQICGHALSSVVNGISVARAITDLQSEVQAASAIPGANGFYAGKTGSTMGAMLAPNYESPRSVQMNFGLQHQFGANTVLALDYVRSMGTHFLLGVDRNHVGDASHLNVNNAVGAINRTLAANAPSCGQVTASTSISGINCYLREVHGASISDFAVNGLDSSGTFANPAAAFPGDNPSLGQGIFLEPIGDSRYRAVDVSIRSGFDHPFRGVRTLNFQASYSWSKFQSNVPTGDSPVSDGQSFLQNAADWNNPNLFFGPSGQDRTHQISFGPVFDLPHAFRASIIGHLDSPLPLTAFLPELNGGGVPGEIFRSDVTGDGTIGDVVPGSNIGSFGGRTAISDLNTLINTYNSSDANHATPAGNALIGNGLITQTQLLQLGGVMPALANAPSTASGPGWLKTVDLRLAWTRVFKERFTIEPRVSAFNILNFANFDNSTNILSGILQGFPGYSLNGSPTVGCGNVSCRSADRTGPGSGVFSLGSARELEFGLHLTF